MHAFLDIANCRKLQKLKIGKFSDFNYPFIKNSAVTNLQIYSQIYIARYRKIWEIAKIPEISLPIQYRRKQHLHRLPHCCPFLSPPTTWAVKKWIWGHGRRGCGSSVAPSVGSFPRCKGPQKSGWETRPPVRTGLIDVLYSTRATTSFVCTLGWWKIPPFSPSRRNDSPKKKGNVTNKGF